MEKTPITTPFLTPGYIPQFDGLRAFAILLVLIAHSGFLEDLPHLGGLELARLGVDLFFVLSGFLITGILLDSKGSRHYFRNFYLRRALRIWPLYYLVLFVAFVVVPAFAPSMRSTAARIWPAFVFYVQNIVFMHSKTYHFALGATWSLAVEEQFYLTWPLLVFLFRKRTLAIISGSLILVSLASRLIGYSHGAPFGFLYLFTLSRLDSIACGSLAALWLRSPCCTFSGWRVRSYQFLGIGAAGTVLTRMIMPNNSGVVGFTFLAFGFTGLLGISLAQGRSSILVRTLSAGWLRYIGKISYGIYLLHFPIFVLWARFLDRQSFCQLNPVARNLLGIAGQMVLVMIAASISWRFFEEPILRLKERFPSGSEMHWPTGGESRP